MPIRTTAPIYLLALSTQYCSPQNRVVINGHPTYRHSPSLHPSKAFSDVIRLFHARKHVSKVLTIVRWFPFEFRHNQSSDECSTRCQARLEHEVLTV